MGPGSHVGFPISAKNKNLVYDHPMNISAKFDPIVYDHPMFSTEPPNDFLQSHNSIGLVVSNKKIFKISTNQNTLWALAAMLDFHQRQKQKSCIWPMNISAKFDSNLFCGFRKKDENVKFP